MNPLLSQRDAARLLGLSTRTLERWRVSGKVDLPYVKLGNSVRYRLEAIERCVASRTMRSTSEEPHE
jgi:predicted site-specific integrase-resolvase